MLLKKCKCGIIAWIQIGKNNKFELICNMCGEPYPSDPIIREAILEIEDILKWIGDRSLSVSIDRIKKLKQILEKSEK